MDHTTPKETRPPINLRIKFRSESLEQFIERYAMDVSRGGIFIRTKEPLAVGTPLKLDFQFQNGTPLMAGDGTVVWIREFDANRTNVPPGMGVRFDKLTPESQAVLEQLLSDKSKRDRGGASGVAAAGAGMAVRRPSSMFSALEAQVQVGDGPSGHKPAAPANRLAAAGQPAAGHGGAVPARAPFSAASLLTGGGTRSPATGPSSSGTSGSSPKQGGIGGFRHLTPNESSVPDEDISDEPTQIAGRLPSFLTSDEEATAVGNSPLAADATDKLVEKSPFGARHADAASPHARRLADLAGPRKSFLDEAPPSPGAAAPAAAAEPEKDTRKDLPTNIVKETIALTVTTPALAAITALRSTAVADAAAVAGPGGAPSPALSPSASTSEPAAAQAPSTAAGASVAATAARSDKRRSPAVLVGVSVIVLGAAAIFLFRFFGSQATESVPLANPSPATVATAEPTTLSPSPAPSAAAPTGVPTPEPTAAPPLGSSPAGATAATALPSEVPAAAPEPTESGHGAGPTKTPPKSNPSSVDVSDASGASAHKSAKHKPTHSTRDQNSDAPAAGVMLPEGTAPHPAAPPPAAPVAAAPSQPTEAAAVPDDGSAAAEAGHQIRVTSRPAGADVALDGQTVGKTPYAGAIQDITAPHFIAVRKDGFEPFEQMISASSAWSKSKGPKGKPGAQILKINAKLKQVGGAPEAKAAGEGSGTPGEAPAKSDVARPDRPLPPSDETAPQKPEGQ